MVVACRMPQISMIAWEDRAGRFIFVSIPDERGRYVRTDPCVGLVGRTFEGCNSTRGEPCKSKGGKYRGGTHWVRRKAGDRRRNHLDHPDDVTDPQDGANVTIKKEPADGP